MKKKIAIINQRYGTEVNGGSEYYTKKLAEHLKEYYDIEVLTTTALDYDTWKPYYSPGVEIEDGVRVHRFQVEKTRNILLFKVINKMVQLFPGINKLLEPLWIKLQGPYCPQLIDYIKEHKEYFDAFIFVTYLYYTTALGLPEVAEKAILVPTAHNEYCIYFQMYEEIFKSPKGIVYLTEEEKKFVEKLFCNRQISNVVAGSGVDIRLYEDSESFLSKFGLSGDYLVYVGRVDISKKCDELFAYFTEFKRKYPNDLKLAVIGKMMMKEPEQKDIVCIGFINEEEKYMVMANAFALVMSSEHESLSLSVLESLAFGVPVIVNGACEVLKSHCQKSNAGLYYRNFKEFEICLTEMMRNREKYERMRYSGKKYIEENYNWDRTIEKYKMMID